MSRIYPSLCVKYDRLLDDPVDNVQGKKSNIVANGKDRLGKARYVN